MKRFFFGLALFVLPVFSLALPVCEDGKASFTCSKSEDSDFPVCSFYQYYSGRVQDCELSDKYKDENGRACFKNGDLYPCDKTPKKPDDLGDKEPKQPDPNPPQGDKQPKNEIAPKGMCYYFGGAYSKSKQEVCSKYGWTLGANGCTTSAHKEGFGIMPTLVQCPKGFEQDEQPKTPKNPPGDGKQPNDGNNGKGSKGEGSGSGEGTGDGNGKGGKGEGSGSGEGTGDGNGKGSKGEGSGSGEGEGEGGGKGMFKGGAGSGQLGDVRVPKSRDGMGWKGDFFLRNPNQCPQDKTMNVLGRSMTFSYAKLCGFLDMLSPVIKAVFMFIAGMLVVKSIRAK
ncbi:virulence factor TspB C-terminal domain-related protein [Eikenella corrodens]|uniref:virulence factor TspB C-terminal domain-related protein n=1 Tax=Eikenella corrodens TaxID=539 RepID=UPI00129A493E|nr:virulence factor TspB C-terminal domain-related protein [Eikenella corrodens]